MGSQNLHKWVGRGFLPARGGLAVSRGEQCASAHVVLDSASILDEDTQEDCGLLGRTNVWITQVLHDALGANHLTGLAGGLRGHLVCERRIQELGLGRSVALLGGFRDDLKVATHLAENLLILVTVDLGELDEGGEGLDVGELAGRGSHKASPSFLGAIGRLGLSFGLPLGTIT